MRIRTSSCARMVPMLLGVVAAREQVRGQDAGPGHGEPSGWYARADAVAHFNVKASMSAANPVLSGGNYNDGFVLPDSGGTASGKTWNWGYTSASQIAGSDLTLHRYETVPAVGNHDLDTSNPAFGGELVGGYQFSSFTFLNKPAHFAVEAAYGYSQFSQDTAFSASGNASYTVDNYGMNGVIAPQPPYAGIAAGPGPLIDLNSHNHSVATAAATTAFSGSLDSSMQNIRLGPAFDMDFTRRFSAGVGLGYSTVYVDSSLKYNETTSFANAAVPNLNSGLVTLQRAEWEPGVYFEMRASYQFSRYVGAFAGGDLQYNSSLEFGDTAHQVKIDLGTTYSAKAGVMIRF